MTPLVERIAAIIDPSAFRKWQSEHTAHPADGRPGISVFAEKARRQEAAITMANRIIEEIGKGATDGGSAQAG